MADKGDNKKDNEDVLDFINSLPDSKANTPKPEGKEDVLEFLDELAAHGKKPLKLEPKKKEDTSEDKKQAQTTRGQESNKETEASNANETELINSANKELEIDPLNSITNWWNKEGATAVSSLWGSITNNANNLSETTYKIASDTTNQINSKRQEFLKEQEENGGKSFEQINKLTHKLNNIFINITDQIKVLNNEDELINVIIINDFRHLDYLNDLVFKNLNKVMSQVEGGIKVNINSYNNYHNHADSESGTSAGASTTLTDSQVDFNMFNGKLLDGEKLCLANLDSSIKNFNKMLEFENKEKTELNEKLKSINKSNIFISFQAINNLTNHHESTNSEDDNVKECIIDQNNSDSFLFLMILHDTTNNIIIKVKSQAFPLIWSQWLMNENLDQFADYEDIDPKEWVKDWIKQGLNLSLGIMAQQYVIKRMGFEA